jgi:hypothetical protein
MEIFSKSGFRALVINHSSIPPSSFLVHQIAPSTVGAVGMQAGLFWPHNSTFEDNRQADGMQVRLFPSHIEPSKVDHSRLRFEPLKVQPPSGRTTVL